MRAPKFGGALADEDSRVKNGHRVKGDPLIARAGAAGDIGDGPKTASFRGAAAVLMNESTSGSESSGAFQSSRMNVTPSGCAAGLMRRKLGPAAASAADAASSVMPNRIPTQSAASAEPSKCSPTSWVRTWASPARN